jgi:hypothetical protein
MFPANDGYRPVSFNNISNMFTPLLRLLITKVGFMACTYNQIYRHTFSRKSVSFFSSDMAFPTARMINAIDNPPASGVPRLRSANGLALPILGMRWAVCCAHFSASPAAWLHASQVESPEIPHE